MGTKADAKQQREGFCARATGQDFAIAAGSSMRLLAADELGGRFFDG
jgi:hypothetical protein